MSGIVAAPSALCMSVLLPTASSSKLVKKGATLKNIQKATEQVLGIQRKDYQLFALVPLNDEVLRQDVIGTNPEIAIRLIDSELTMSSVEEVMRSRDKYKSMMQKTNEALQAYVEEIKRMRKFLMETGGAADIDDEAKESILKKAMQSKQLQEENKKLRKLIKTQLENSENLRLETQTTIETLREEFDLLVKELAKYKKKDSTGLVNGDQKGSPSQQQNPSNNLNNQNFGMNENYAPSNNIRSDQKNKKDSQSSIIGASNAQQSKKEQEGSTQNTKGAPLGVPKLKLGK